MPRNGVARIAVFFSLIALPAWTMVACEATPTTLEPATPKPAAGLTDVATATPVETPTPPPSLPPDTPPSVPTTLAPDTSAVEVNFVIAKLNAEGQVSVLKGDDELISCPDTDAADPRVGCADVYGLYFKPVQEAYIYALQQDETGEPAVLFPNGDYSDQSNPVAAGTEIWVPESFEEWFYLALNRTPEPIEETIFVVAGAERVDVLETYIACVVNDCSDGDTVQAQLLELLDTLGPGGTTKRIATIPDPEGNMRDLEELILESRRNNEFIYQVKFKNLPPG